MPELRAQTLEEIRATLDAHGCAPKKSLGQNFLIDRNLVSKLVDEAGVNAGDLVLEVGPGTGTLTGELLGRGCAVIACELDDGLADAIGGRFGAHPAFTLVRGDCLASKRALSPALTETIGGRPFSLVANLPYQAATPLMLTLLAEHPGCGVMAVTIQKEVADRLMAGPGSKVYGSISVVAQVAGAREPDREPAQRVLLASPEGDERDGEDRAAGRPGDGQHRGAGGVLPADLRGSPQAARGAAERGGPDAVAMAREYRADGPDRGVVAPGGGSAGVGVRGAVGLGSLRE
jgi:16S rRNA (adenine1518-N6/adenine1519-N6)-dimethyltransferase